MKIVRVKTVPMLATLIGKLNVLPTVGKFKFASEKVVVDND